MKYRYLPCIEVLCLDAWGEAASPSLGAPLVELAETLLRSELGEVGLLCLRRALQLDRAPEHLLRCLQVAIAVPDTGTPPLSELIDTMARDVLARLRTDDFQNRLKLAVGLDAHGPLRELSKELFLETGRSNVANLPTLVETLVLLDRRSYGDTPLRMAHALLDMLTEPASVYRWGQSSP